MRYRSIAIEGNIGAGKTTLATKIAEQYGGRLILEEFADNPFLPRFYANPEKHAFPLELFFLAERYHQLNREATADLFQPLTVSDYYIYKSLIFARSNLQEDEYALFSRLFHIMYPNLSKIDLLVYLYLDVAQLQSNIKRRGREYEQKIPDDYLLDIQDKYLDFLKKQQDLRILILDTNKVDFVNNYSDYQKILEIIDADYELGVHRIVL